MYTNSDKTQSQSIFSSGNTQFRQQTNIPMPPTLSAAGLTQIECDPDNNRYLLSTNSYPRTYYIFCPTALNPNFYMPIAPMVWIPGNLSPCPDPAQF